MRSSALPNRRPRATSECSAKPDWLLAGRRGTTACTPSRPTGSGKQTTGWNAVIRRVTTEGDTHVVALEQEFPTSAADLWDACTNPERLPRWFEPVTGQLRPGGRYRLTTNGTEGAIKRCVAPTQLRITWEYDGDRSEVDVLITEQESDRATLRLQHVVPDNEHWHRYGPSAAGVGWDESCHALSLHLAEDVQASPEAMETFNDSDQGREFLTVTACPGRRRTSPLVGRPRRHETPPHALLAAYSGEK